MRAARPSRTAEAVCYVRAAERLRPPNARIVDDPYAASFLGPLYRAALATGLPLTGGTGVVGPLATYVAARHRYIDEALLASLDAPRPVEQIVVLGAGYDARAWRFADRLARRVVFEVDHPATQARKQALAARLTTLPPPARGVDVRRVPVDFAVDRLEDALPRAGLRAGRPTFVVWEGVSMYLHGEAVRATLTSLHALLGPGSRLAMDAWFLLDDPGLVATLHRSSARLLALVGEPLTFALHPTDAPALLAASGWTVLDLADAATLGRRHVPDGRAVYPATYVLTAARSEG